MLFFFLSADRERCACEESHACADRKSSRSHVVVCICGVQNIICCAAEARGLCFPTSRSRALCLSLSVSLFVCLSLFVICSQHKGGAYSYMLNCPHIALREERGKRDRESERENACLPNAAYSGTQVFRPYNTCNEHAAPPIHNTQHTPAICNSPPTSRTNERTNARHRVAAFVHVTYTHRYRPFVRLTQTRWPPAG